MDYARKTAVKEGLHQDYRHQDQSKHYGGHSSKVQKETGIFWICIQNGCLKTAFHCATSGPGSKRAEIVPGKDG